MSQLDPVAPASCNLAGPGLRAFFSIAVNWQLNVEEQMKLLGVTSRLTLQRWNGRAMRHEALALHRDTLERISYVLGIYKAINTLVPIPERADAWMRAANSGGIFHGQSAVDRMTSGNIGDLYAVRHYLDAQCG